jgi:cellulose biosynthesis protein BcsQ
MHIIVALLKAGKRVASFDLDLNQLTLTRYLGNRHEWVRKQEQKLEVSILNGLSSGILRLRTMLRRYRDEGT